MTKNKDKKKNNTKEAVLSELTAFIQPFFAQKLLTHLYVACGRFDGPVFFEYKTHENVFFDLASLTKVLSTLTLVYKQKKRGLDLYKTVGECLGSKKNVFTPQVNGLKIFSLLRHNSGLPFWRNFWVNYLTPETYLLSREQRLERVSAKLNAIPCSEYHFDRYVYSDLGYILLGVVLELLNEKELGQQFREFCSEELLLSGEPSLFFPSDFANLEKKRFVPTAFCPTRERILTGEVHDENGASLGGVCGHTGLFGSGEGLISYFNALWSSQIGIDIFKDNAQLALQNEPNQKCMLGWMKESQEGVFHRELVLSHLGFTGTGIWLFPEKNAYIFILTNRVISSRLSSWIHSFRMQLCKLLVESYLEIDA